MRSYELVVVFNPSLGQNGLLEEVKRIQGIIAAQGGSEIGIENWGKREFAFKIKHEKFGFYVNFSFGTSNPDLIKEVQRVLSISDSVVRYQSYRSDVKARKFQGSLRSLAQREKRDKNGLPFDFGDDSEVDVGIN